MKKFNPETFPVEDIIEMICDEYSITPAEFNSTFKYGSLPEARQLLCLGLLSLGAKSADISLLTGYAPGRVNYTINAGRKLMKETPFFKKRHDKLLKILQALKC